MPQATRAGWRLLIAHRTPSAMRWATNRWYSVNSFSGWSGFFQRALTDECVCVQDMSIRSAGRPVASVICRLASSSTSRLM